ncbi:putative valine--tRNA ligase [Apostichopus japonicus]|uniref:valine--tRNA ligase n=1 Tax=Stichopus japonicus TaxID=307972 RepID=A0A2G8JKP8_STIJA|nr:putative valine--tRNA ligase [Apostichopus japonicus]
MLRKSITHRTGWQNLWLYKTITQKSQRRLLSLSCIRHEKKKDTSCPLPKSYDPSFVESGWYSWWEQSGFFWPEYSSRKKLKNDKEKPFIMCLPPPNVTGTLHLGHALMVAIQDSLIRWHRMHGRETLWIPGVDHAGIATQIVVEKKLWKEQRILRHQMGREKFVEEVWRWREECGHEIDEQFKRLGASLDWSRPNFTMSEEFSRAVQEAFITLHEDGTIYRGNRLVNWSCSLRSTISDIEVEKQSIEGATAFQVPGYQDPIQFGYMYYFSYPVVGSGSEIPVATTRIETMLGDVAIAVHPEDTRYKHLIGQEVIHPFVDRLLPIITSETVDMEFGTGAVKITPAHDFNDYDVGKRHSLDLVNILTEMGLPRFHAREKIIEALKLKGLYQGKKEHAMVVPVYSRSKDIVEPLLKEQWFVRCDDLAKEAIAAVDNGDLVIQPMMHQKTWNHWLTNIRDWCISRQLWWGHRIPAYHVKLKHGHPMNDEVDKPDLWVSGHSYEDAIKKAAEKLKVDRKFLELTQDVDVLDTWFSSALFPFAVHGWPSQTEDLNRFYPSTLLETGHDILFFWVARMVMMGQKLTGVLPFKEVYLHSMVRDAHGRKMSKSLGNVIDPVDVIQGASLESLHARLDEGLLDHVERERSRMGQAADYPKGIPECGTDALRFALCTYRAQVDDINLDVNKVQMYRFFCNKIWNASLFTINALDEGYKPLLLSEILPDCSLMDRWILSRLSSTVRVVNDGFHGYDFPVVTSAMYKFWVHNLCDVYLESIKSIVRSEEREALVSKNVLHICVEAGLRLLSPFMPFLSEELFQRLSRRPQVDEPSICLAPYPTTEELPTLDVQLEDKVRLCLDIVSRIRSIQSEFGISKATGYIMCNNVELRDVIIDMCPTMRTLSKCKILTVCEQEPTGCLATTISTDCALFVEAKDFNVSEILTKLRRKSSKAEAELSKLKQQMSIENYEQKVPIQIREKHTERMQVLKTDVERLQTALLALENVT